MIDNRCKRIQIMRRAQSSRQHRAGASQDKGVALIFAILAILLISLMGLALTGSGILTLSLSTNDRDLTEALHIADAGISHANAILFTKRSADFTQYLLGEDLDPCTGDELSNGALFTDPITSRDDGGVDFGSGRYDVKICDDHVIERNSAADPDLNLPNDDPNVDMDGLIRIISTGYTSNGATASVEVMMMNRALPAMLVNGNLRISGNPKLLGPGGAIHTNANLAISGNPCAQRHLSSTGTLVSTPGTGTGAGCTSPPYTGTDSPPDLRPGDPPIFIPAYNPSTYSIYADYTLTRNAEVFDNADPPNLLNIPAEKKWCPADCWDFNDGDLEWTAGGTDVPQGTYYAVQSSIAISGNVGMGTPNFQMTLLADGWIEISGNPEIAPALTLEETAISMMAGTDLKINGDATNPYSGLFYAGHQIDFSGNPLLTGQVVAQDIADTSPPYDPGGKNLITRDADGFMSISGNATIIYTQVGAIKRLDPGGWRECRGIADPADPCSYLEP